MMARSFSSAILGHGGSISEPQMGTELSNFGNHKHPICNCGGFKKSRSHKGEEPFSGKISATFRRALSDSNLIPLFARDEDIDNQRPEKLRSRRVMCSRKHGLLSMVAESKGELNGKDLLNEERAGSSVNLENHFQNLVSPGKDQSQAAGAFSEGEYKRPATHKMNPVLRVEDEKPAGAFSEGEYKRPATHKMNPVLRVEDEKPAVRERISENLIMDSYSSVEIGEKGMTLVCSDRGPRPAVLGEEQSMIEGIDDVDAGVEVVCGGGKISSSADSISTDEYYQKMLVANPHNPLLLRNYAKFLHEVKGDMERAEKCYGRAILANPGDGEILSLYAKFIWETTNDTARAEAYFETAVKAASEDCYVLGAYANFLWDSEDNEDENHSL